MDPYPPDWYLMPVTGPSCHRELPSHFACFNQLQLFCSRPPQIQESNPHLHSSIYKKSVGFLTSFSSKPTEKIKRKSNKPHIGSLQPAPSQTMKTPILPSATRQGWRLFAPASDPSFVWLRQCSAADNGEDGMDDRKGSDTECRSIFLWVFWLSELTWGVGYTFQMWVFKYYRENKLSASKHVWNLNEFNASSTHFIPHRIWPQDFLIGNCNLNWTVKSKYFRVFSYVHLLWLQ